MRHASYNCTNKFKCYFVKLFSCNVWWRWTDVTYMRWWSSALLVGSVRRRRGALLSYFVSDYNWRIWNHLHFFVKHVSMHWKDSLGVFMWVVLLMSEEDHSRSWLFLQEIWAKLHVARKMREGSYFSCICAVKCLDSEERGLPVLSYGWWMALFLQFLQQAVYWTHLQAFWCKRIESRCHCFMRNCKTPDYKDYKMHVLWRKCAKQVVSSIPNIFDKTKQAQKCTANYDKISEISVIFGIHDTSLFRSHSISLTSVS